MQLYIQLKSVLRNLNSQKKDLHDFYCSYTKQCCEEYKQLKRSLSSKLSRLAKKTNLETYNIEVIIDEKKSYNYFASKIFNAKTIDKLVEISQDIVCSEYLGMDAKKLLSFLINKHKQILKL